jgi:hypothetical protein
MQDGVPVVICHAGDPFITSPRRLEHFYEEASHSARETSLGKFLPLLDGILYRRNTSAHSASSSIGTSTLHRQPHSIFMSYHGSRVEMDE